MHTSVPSLPNKDKTDNLSGMEPTPDSKTQMVDNDFDALITSSPSTIYQPGTR